MDSARARLEFPMSWVRCWWCGKVEVYGSKEVEAVKRRGDTVYMHPKCARDHAMDSWGNEPPLHGGD